jgi:hypothetical protein
MFYRPVICIANIACRCCKGQEKHRGHPLNGLSLQKVKAERIETEKIRKIEGFRDWKTGN